MPKPDYFMGFARHAATASKDSTKVGAVLVDRDGTVLLTSYNGPPRGVRDLPERFERPAKYAYASHAERNLIAFAARKGIATDGCSVYVTHAPCAECMKSIIQAGITCVYAGGGVTVMATDDESEIMAFEAGVRVERI
jgi:dCMP deaminase